MSVEDRDSNRQTNHFISSKYLRQTVRLVEPISIFQIAEIIKSQIFRFYNARDMSEVVKVEVPNHFIAPYIKSSKKFMVRKPLRRKIRV